VEVCLCVKLPLTITGNFCGVISTLTAPARKTGLATAKDEKDRSENDKPKNALSKIMVKKSHRTAITLTRQIKSILVLTRIVLYFSTTDRSTA
jgi:hypothetical protein